MRADGARRKAQTRPGRPQRDEVDVVKYKQGSASDRTRRGAV
jgi:hypothetical protein